MYHVYIWTLVFVSALISPRPAVATTTPRPTTTPTIPTGSCVVDGIIYADGEDVERDVNNCYWATCDNGYVSNYDHQCFLDPPMCLGTEIQVPGECCKLCITTTPIPTTIPTTTIPTTTTTTHVPPGACEHDGRIYMNGEDVERDVNNCYWATCDNGYVSFYDHHCFLDPPMCLGTEIQVPGECCKLCITTTTIPTTIPTTTIPTTTSTTTIPTTTTTTHVPPGACEYHGRIYMNGEDVERGVNNCYWATCENGYVSFYHPHCFLDQPVCLGTEIEVPGECCKLCITTTTIPTTIPATTLPTTTSTTTIPTTTTTPHLPPGACEYDGRVVLNGVDIERSPCGGLLCQDGQVIAWDDKCAFYTPECNGTLIPVEGQCCPLCVQVTTVKPPETTTTIPITTTTTTTTHVPPGGCEHDGRIFMNGDDIERSPCGGLLCQDGQVIAWDDKCAFYTPECNGTLIPVEGQCCPLCVQVTTVKPPETSRRCHPHHRFLQRLLHRNLHRLRP